ncbi:hypothetical protein [Bacillus sp. es.034]|uniref:hypothetical protein n=1 Tax=Bacillus sp. es.034 TaxID=1761763 RepID=UPI000BF7366F|nr:hypothetical protein [Bacillus sp. es.034]PFG07156.1 hypothetical protein ATG71_4027 [Bacillus sp. es.034]
MKKEQIQPHCMVCCEPFKRTDEVLTDNLFTQIQHTKCFIYRPEFIKDKGTYEEIVNMYPDYKKVFIVSDKPVTNFLLVSSLRKKK